MKRMIMFLILLCMLFLTSCTKKVEKEIFKNNISIISRYNPSSNNNIYTYATDNISLSYDECVLRIEFESYSKDEYEYLELYKKLKDERLYVFFKAVDSETFWEVFEIYSVDSKYFTGEGNIDNPYKIIIEIPFNKLSLDDGFSKIIIGLKLYDEEEVEEMYKYHTLCEYQFFIINSSSNELKKFKSDYDFLYKYFFIGQFEFQGYDLSNFDFDAYFDSGTFDINGINPVPSKEEFEKMKEEFEKELKKYMDSPAHKRID